MYLSVIVSHMMKLIDCCHINFMNLALWDGLVLIGG